MSYFAITAKCGHAFISDNQDETSQRCLYCEQQENKKLRATLARRTDALRQAREVIAADYAETGSQYYENALAAIDAALADDAPHA